MDILSGGDDTPAKPAFRMRKAGKLFFVRDI
jgi:hypothetical protein